MPHPAGRLVHLLARSRALARELRRNVQRLPHDNRARKTLLALVGLLTIMALYVAFYIHNPGATVMMFLGFGVAFFLRSRFAREDSTRFSFSSDTGATPSRGTPAQANYLAIAAIRIACLLDRAHGELYLKTHRVPDGSEVILRRRILATVQQQNLLETAEPLERNLLIAPDGAWSTDEIAAALMLQETLRCILYCLRIEPLLCPIEDVYQLRSELATATLQDAERLLAATDTRSAKDLGAPTDIAQGFYLRCLAEQQRRGIHQAEDPGIRSDLDEIAGSMRGESNDLLIGTATVASSSNTDLNLAAAQSWRRWQTLEAVSAHLQTGSSDQLDPHLHLPPIQEISTEELPSDGSLIQ